jgi:signal transduction histidine kinase/ligand-binding sensor domain-containing protein/DNA-binding NarL/FixJ family response regulator|nr:hybrid sensor histidine kinase/response regulator transcription factor [Bacteroides intestinalis]
MKKCFAIYLLLFFVSISFHAANKEFKVFDTSDGLSDNTVKCITQDSLGFIWMGTFNGLCRFDGVNFITYKHNPSGENSIAHNQVEAILATGGDLWVGTENGLNRYPFAEDKFYACYTQMASGEKRQIKSPIQSIMQCGGKIFVLTSYNELFVQVNENQFTTCNYGKELTYLSIANYKDHLFLTFTTDGLYLIDAWKEVIVSWLPFDSQSLSRHNLYNLYYSPTEETAFSGAGIGHEGEAFKITSTGKIERRNDFMLSDIKAITDYKGKVLFGTDGGGLVEWDDGKITHIIPQNSSISSDAIHALFVDREEGLWVGTYRGGLNFHSPSYDSFHTLNMMNGTLSHNVVTAICPDKEQIYIGLDGGGLNVYDRVTRQSTVYSRQNSDISGNNVMSMCADAQYLWMGIYEKGLCRFSRSSHTFKNYDLSAESKNNNANQIWDVCRDDKGMIWILGHTLFIFNTNNESFTTIDEIHGASNIIFDADTVWIGSTYSGLYKLDKKSHAILAHYYKGAERVSLESDAVRYIFMDSARNLWLSLNCGLFKLNLETSDMISYTGRRELADNRVVNIMEDTQGYLWMGTYKGLYKYTPYDDSFSHIGGMDNWKNAQFNYHACAQDSTSIYMGFTKGLLYFDPSKINQIPHRTNPVCFRALEFPDHPDESFHWHDGRDKTITLPYDRNFFTIRFSVAEMFAPKGIRFLCYMEGFETGWKETGTERVASYTNVPPGKYTFYVKSTDISGRWNPNVSSLHIIITPPWWQTEWAWCLWIILITGILFSVFEFYRHELNIKHLVQLKEIEKDTARNINEAKLRFYTNVVHELRTPIFLITAPLEELMSEKQRTVSVPKSYLAGMYRNAMKLNKLITRMIDLRKLEQGQLQLVLHSQNVVSFCKNLVPDYEALCQQKEIVFHFLPEKTLVKVAFDAEKLEIILSNLVSNAFKYTPEGGKVVLSIHETDHEVVFTIEDNGTGIPKEFQEKVFDRFFQVNPSQSISTGDGIGLSFVKYLVELHGGTIRVESEVGKGSAFIFTLPLGTATDEISVEDQETVEPPVATKVSSVSEVQVSIPTAGHTLLLIDDEPEILEMLEHSLVEDFRILKATNGMYGLELLRKEMPDLVICDIMMPGMDGMEFLRLVRGDKTLLHIPVIMLTAKMDEEDQMSAFDSGADVYLTKPISLKYLRNRIDHLLTRSERVNISSALNQMEKSYTKEEQRFLLKCKNVIDEHLMNPDLGVVFLAEKLGMSHSSFYRKIKAVTGMTGIDFINEYRIFKAVQLFKSGETNISSVCAKCGFNDIKSFREAFKKKMHILPKQYVIQLSEN